MTLSLLRLGALVFVCAVVGCSRSPSAAYTDRGETVSDSPVERQQCRFVDHRGRQCRQLAEPGQSVCKQHRE